MVFGGLSVPSAQSAWSETWKNPSPCTQGLATISGGGGGARTATAHRATCEQTPRPQQAKYNKQGFFFMGLDRFFYCFLNVFQSFFKVF